MTAQPALAYDFEETSTQYESYVSTDDIPAFLKGKAGAHHQVAFNNDATSQRLETSQDQGLEPKLARTAFLSIAPTPSAQPIPLAEWNGYVTAIPDDESPFFYAKLTGLRGEGVVGETDDAQIPIDDVSSEDKELLRPGNFFRLCVMSKTLPSGQPIRWTQVVFRRMPAYRSHDLEAAAERGRDIARRLRVE